MSKSIYKGFPYFERNALITVSIKQIHKQHILHYLNFLPKPDTEATFKKATTGEPLAFRLTILVDTFVSGVDVNNSESPPLRSV
jgi:hypothetical protein